MLSIGGKQLKRGVQLIGQKSCKIQRYQIDTGCVCQNYLQQERSIQTKIKYNQINLATNQLVTKSQEHAEIMSSKKKKDKDRYGIFKINDIDELFDLSRNRRLHLTLNDYVSIFLRVTELRLDSSLKSMYGLSEIYQKIQKEITKADEEEPSIGRLSLCLARSKICEDINFWISLSDHILANRFDCDYDEVYAAMIGFNGVKKYSQHEWQIELIEKIYLKLEIALIHHLKMQKYNIKTLRLICDVMYQNGRFTPDFLKEIEYMLNFQLMEASSNFGSNEALMNFSIIKEEILFPQFGVKYNDQLLQLLSSFAYFFAKSHFESPLLFNFTTFYVSECIERQHIFDNLALKRKQDIAAQRAQAHSQVLEEEHSQNSEDTFNTKKHQQEETNSEEPLTELVNPLTLDGSGLASLLHFWDFMIVKNSSLILPMKIRDWLVSEIEKEDRVYDIEDLNTLYKSFELLQLDNLERAKYQFFLEKKLFEVDSKAETIQIEHIKEYLEIRSAQEYADDLNEGEQEGDNQYENREEMKKQRQEDNRNQEVEESECKEDLRLISKGVYKFLDSICEQQLCTFTPYSVYYFLHHIDQYDQIKHFQQFLNHLPEYVLKNIEKYEFDEVCYFVLVCHQNSHLLDDEISTSSFWGNIYYIKEHIKGIAFSRGFKLDPSSYFSQLLHKIDMAEFFNGGE